MNPIRFTIKWCELRSGGYWLAETIDAPFAICTDKCATHDDALLEIIARVRDAGLANDLERV